MIFIYISGRCFTIIYKIVLLIVVMARRLSIWKMRLKTYRELTLMFCMHFSVVLKHCLCWKYVSDFCYSEQWCCILKVTELYKNDLNLSEKQRYICVDHGGDRLKSFLRSKKYKIMKWITYGVNAYSCSSCRILVLFYMKASKQKVC